MSKIEDMEYRIARLEAALGIPSTEGPKPTARGGYTPPRMVPVHGADRLPEGPYGYGSQDR